MVYKWCVVYKCTNTSISTPEKVFVSVPTDPKRRKMWLQLSRRDPMSILSHTNVFMCEDHFDLKNDMENYMQLKIMGSEWVKRVRLKPHCVPSRFSWNRKHELDANESHLGLDERRRSMSNDTEEVLIEESKESSVCIQGLSGDGSDTEATQLEEESMPSVNDKLCRVCFTTDDIMFSITSSSVLNEAYETLTGILTSEEEHLPRYLCGQCAGRLMNCARFRRRSLRAHSMLLDIVRTHGQVTTDLIQSEMQNNNLFSYDSADNSNDPFGFDSEDLEEINETTEALDDTELEDTDMYKNVNDVKIEIDYGNEFSHVSSEDSTNNMAVSAIKMENDCSNEAYTDKTIDRSYDIAVSEIKKEYDDWNNETDTNDLSETNLDSNLSHCRIKNKECENNIAAKDDSDTLSAIGDYGDNFENDFEKDILKYELGRTPQPIATAELRDVFAEHNYAIRKCKYK